MIIMSKDNKNGGKSVVVFITVCGLLALAILSCGGYSIVFTEPLNYILAFLTAIFFGCMVAVMVRAKKAERNFTTWAVVEVLSSLLFIAVAIPSGICACRFVNIYNKIDNTIKNDLESAGTYIDNFEAEAKYIIKSSAEGFKNAVSAGIYTYPVKKYLEKEMKWDPSKNDSTEIGRIDIWAKYMNEKLAEKCVNCGELLADTKGNISDGYPLLRLLKLSNISEELSQCGNDITEQMKEFYQENHFVRVESDIVSGIYDITVLNLDIDTMDLGLPLLLDMKESIQDLTDSDSSYAYLRGLFVVVLVNLLVLVTYLFTGRARNKLPEIRRGANKSNYGIEL